MLHAKVIIGELFCLDFVHCGAGIGNRTYLVGIKLFPPVKRGGNVNRDGNHPHKLPVVVSCCPQLFHKSQVVFTYCITAVWGTVMFFGNTYPFTVYNPTFTTIYSRVAIRFCPRVQRISHTTNSRFPAVSLCMFKLNHSIPAFLRTFM